MSILQKGFFVFTKCVRLMHRGLLSVFNSDPHRSADEKSVIVGPKTSKEEIDEGEKKRGKHKTALGDASARHLFSSIMCAASTHEGE